MLKTLATRITTLNSSLSVVSAHTVFHSQFFAPISSH